MKAIFRHLCRPGRWGALLRPALALGLLWTLANPAAAGEFTAAPADSLADRAALLAARGDVAELRPLFAASGRDFPPYVRLYCEMALARADHNWARMTACIDTLTTGYDRELGIKGRLSLSLLKAETLHRQGLYGEMAAYCRREIKYYRGRRVKTELLDPFRALQRKGERLGADDDRTAALRLADLDEAFALGRRFADRLAAFDDYARRRCRLTLADAFNRPAEAAALADSLMTLNADSLDGEDFARCVRTAARALMATGEWQRLAGLVDRVTASGRGGAVPLGHYRRLAEGLKACPPVAVERPAADVVLPVTYVWPPLIEARLGGGAPLLFGFNTGQQHTFITAADAAAAGLHVLPDTVELVSPVGLVDASPVMVPSLSLGGITLRNVLAYVPADVDDVPAEYVRSLGLNELSHLGTVDLYAEKIIVRAQQPADASAAVAQPNLRRGADSGLLLQADGAGERHLLVANTCYPQNVVLPDVLDASGGSVALSVGGRPARPSAAGAAESQQFGGEGVLGHPFFQDNPGLRLDLAAMRLTLPTEAIAAPDTASLFFVQRNLSALTLLDAVSGEMAAALTAAAHFEAAAVTLPGETVVVPYVDAATLAVAARVNRREVVARPDLALPPDVPVVLSARAAKRLKVRVTEPQRREASGRGVIDSLRLGETVLRNVACVIEPGKADTVRYGTGLLRLVPQVSFDGTGLSLSAAAEPEAEWAPMLLTTPLTAQAETPTGYATVALTTDETPAEPVLPAGLTLAGVPVEAAACVAARMAYVPAVVLSLRRLVDRGGRVTMNFKAMRLGR